MTVPDVEPPSSGLPPSERVKLLRYRTGAGLFVLFLGLLLLVFLVQRGPSPSPPPTRTLLLYSFSGFEEPLRESLLPAFVQRWEAERGERLEVIATYAGSGWIVDRVLRHFPAEVAVLASPLDASRVDLLAEKGEASAATVVARSRLALVTRPGNPLRIGSLEDLLASEAEVIVPDPDRSGLGRLAVLAVWALDPGAAADPDRAVERLRRFRDRIAELPSSAHEASRLFAAGRGDVVIAYEHEARGLEGELVFPPRTVVAEHLALTLRPRSGQPVSPAPAALVEYLGSPQAQELIEGRGLVRADRPLPAPPPELYLPSDLAAPRELDRRILDLLWRQVVDS